MTCIEIIIAVDVLCFVLRWVASYSFSFRDRSKRLQIKCQGFGTHQLCCKTRTNFHNSKPFFRKSDTQKAHTRHDKSLNPRMNVLHTVKSVAHGGHFRPEQRITTSPVNETTLMLDPALLKPILFRSKCQCIT